MLKRIMAWVLLVGFVFLLLNIAIFRFYWEISILIYLVVAIWFIFTNKPLPSRKKKSIQKTEGSSEDVQPEFDEKEILDYMEKESKNAGGKNNIE
jgi:hypothetical protein